MQLRFSIEVWIVQLGLNIMVGVNSKFKYNLPDKLIIFEIFVVLQFQFHHMTCMDLWMCAFIYMLDYKFV